MQSHAGTAQRFAMALASTRVTHGLCCRVPRATQRGASHHTTWSSYTSNLNRCFPSAPAAAVSASPLLKAHRPRAALAGRKATVRRARAPRMAHSARPPEVCYPFSPTRLLARPAVQARTLTVTTRAVSGDQTWAEVRLAAPFESRALTTDSLFHIHTGSLRRGPACSTSCD